MIEYETGAVKLSPDNNAVGIRTVFPNMPVFADRQWAVMTVDTGGYYCTYETVAEWPDVAAVPAEPTE